MLEPRVSVQGREEVAHHREVRGHLLRRLPASDQARHLVNGAVDDMGDAPMTSTHRLDGVGVTQIDVLVLDVADVFFWVLDATGR